MRILLLTPRLPWPPLDGGRIAMARLAESLARGGAEVEILSLNPRKHHGDAHASPLPIEAIEIDTARVMAPMLSREAPFIVSRFISNEFRAALRRTLQRFAPDIVQIESPFMLPYVRDVREASRARVVLRSLNVEFRIWEGLAAAERNPLRRVALRRVASSLKRYEVQEINTPDAIVPISAADADDFRKLGCTRPIHVVPCGVALPDLGDVTPQPNSVGFIGSLDFRPNQSAVEWILDELWPRVIARAPEAKLVIAGGSPPEWLRRRARDAGFRADVRDAKEFMQEMSVIIAPLFAGGGMRIKVLEAMALARPIVATTIGFGGIDAHHQRDILIADDVESFADSVALLLHDREAATRIGNAARATVGARYDSDALGRELLHFYESLSRTL